MNVFFPVHQKKPYKRFNAHLLSAGTGHADQVRSDFQTLLYARVLSVSSVKDDA